LICFHRYRLWNGAIVLELDPFKEIVVCHFLILLGHITSPN
jgi:hypothetical protein